MADATWLFYSKPLVYPCMSFQVGQEQGTYPEAVGSEQSLSSQHGCYKLRAFAFQLPALKNKNTKDYQTLEAAKGMQLSQTLL